MIDPVTTPLLDVADTHLTPDAGLRKLVRPRLIELPGVARRHVRRQPAPLLTHQNATVMASAQYASHAELLYFQKQVQAQTLMVFVFDDGERIEGVIEWFDVHVIKVRHVTRTMIYKSSIKYLYKAADAPAR